MTLGEISDLLAWAAATAYTIAMIAFAINLASTRGPGAIVDSGSTSVRRRKSLGIAMSTTWLGVLFHAAAVITRGLAAGRAPWANMYEFCLVGTFVAVAVFLGVCLRRDLRFLGVFITGLAVVFLLVGLTQFHIKADGVQPALQSYWLVIHVGVAVAATGVLTLGFVTSVLQLLRGSYDEGSTLLRGEGVPARGKMVLAWRVLKCDWLASVPTPEKLEVLSFRINAVGFVMWTFTVIGGAIWAEDAWGRYWGWDPKEVWSFVVWVVYAAYLHARATQRWTGKRAAYLVIAGYVCVIFNFTGVNILFTGKHSYSGL